MTSLSNNALNIVRTQNHFYEFNVAGLTPNTKHTIMIDEVDHSWATKQFGKDFGADMISDNDGKMKIGILFELPFPRDQNFELPRTNTLQFQNEQLSSGTRQDLNIVSNIRVLELKTADGSVKAQFMLNLPTILSAGTVSTLFPIE